MKWSRILSHSNRWRMDCYNAKRPILQEELDGFERALHKGDDLAPLTITQAGLGDWKPKDPRTHIVEEYGLVINSNGKQLPNLLTIRNYA